MRADDAALVALRAFVHVHARHLDRNAPLLELTCSERDTAARLEDAHRQHVSVETVARSLDSLGEVLSCCCCGTAFICLDIVTISPWRGAESLCPGLWHTNFNNAIEASIHASNVHVHHFVALLAIHLTDALLQQLDSSLEVHHTAQLEEHCLHDHVNALAHSHLHTNLGGINYVKLGLLLSKVVSHLGWELFIKLVACPGAVDDNGSTWLQIPCHVVLVHVTLLVDSQVICRVHSVRRPDWAWPKSQVADSHSTAFLCVVLKICLCI
mmetsp:Transcript_81192/g.238570  ORF Transcript_81192/g.238570 Transcript_81192/m.238570 type:complete len:268 (+) Transcript_81192:312-1115(+)